jgi:hypothetical protein
MRLPALLLVTVVLLSAFSFAQDEALISSDPSYTDSNQTAEQAIPEPADAWRVPLYRAERFDSAADAVCFTLRSYIMKRESPYSDVTRRVKHVTCQPAWKFEFRSAVAAPEK